MGDAPVALVRTASGSPDRKRISCERAVKRGLEDQVTDAVSTTADEIGPAIVDIFAHEIKTDAVGLDDNFFDLGGDSLAAENIILSIQQRFGVEIQTAALLEASTPRELAQMVARLRGTDHTRRLIVRISRTAGGEPLPMIHGMSGSPLFANRFGSAVRERYDLLAVRGMGLEAGETPQNEVRDIARSYFEGLRTVTGKPPRQVGGICTGALLSVEVGRLTYQATGQRPSLVLIDPPPRGSAWMRPEKGEALSEKRKLKMDRAVGFWSWLRDALAKRGFGNSALGRKARREAFKKTQTRALAGYSPEPFPCNLLVIASSEWGEALAEEYRGWETDEMSVRVMVMPGRHREFRHANAQAIDEAILGFLESHAVKAPGQAPGQGTVQAPGGERLEA